MCLVLSFAGAKPAYTLRHGSVYFSRKTKMADCRFVEIRRALFGCSLFAHIDPSGSLYGRCSRWLGSLAPVQHQAREEVATNRFDSSLLYIATLRISNPIQLVSYVVVQCNL